jgi:hypothetical protein
MQAQGIVSGRWIAYNRHDSVLFDHHLRASTPRRRNTEMQAMKNEAEQTRRQYAALTKLYRPIGPAAIAAALICTAKKRPAGKSARKQS